LKKAGIDLLKKEDLSAKHEDKLNDMQMNSREVSTINDDEWGRIAAKFGLDVSKKARV